MNYKPFFCLSVLGPHYKVMPIDFVSLLCYVGHCLPFVNDITLYSVSTIRSEFLYIKSF